MVETAITLDCSLGPDSDPARLAMIAKATAIPGIHHEVQTPARDHLRIIWSQTQDRSGLAVRDFFTAVVTYTRPIRHTIIRAGAVPRHFHYAIVYDELVSADVHIAREALDALSEMQTSASVRVKQYWNMPDDPWAPSEGSWFRAFLAIYSDTCSPNTISEQLDLEPRDAYFKPDSSCYSWHTRIEARKRSPEVLLNRMLDVLESRTGALNALQESCLIRAGATFFVRPPGHSTAVFNIDSRLAARLQGIGVNDSLWLSFNMM